MKNRPVVVGVGGWDGRIVDPDQAYDSPGLTTRRTVINALRSGQATGGVMKFSRSNLAVSFTALACAGVIGGVTAVSLAGQQQPASRDTIVRQVSGDGGADVSPSAQASATAAASASAAATTPATETTSTTTPGSQPVTTPAAPADPTPTTDPAPAEPTGKMAPPPQLPGAPPGNPQPPQLPTPGCLPQDPRCQQSG